MDLDLKVPNQSSFTENINSFESALALTSSAGGRAVETSAVTICSFIENITNVVLETDQEKKIPKVITVKKLIFKISIILKIILILSTQTIIT